MGEIRFGVAKESVAVGELIERGKKREECWNKCKSVLSSAKTFS